MITNLEFKGSTFPRQGFHSSGTNDRQEEPLVLHVRARSFRYSEVPPRLANRQHVIHAILLHEGSRDSRGDRCKRVQTLPATGVVGNRTKTFLIRSIQGEGTIAVYPSILS